MKKFPSTIFAALAAFLVLAFAGTAVHADGDKDPITLVGELAESEAGGYLLIEQESGDSIAVSGSVMFGDHVGETVKLTGKWVEEEDGYRSFKVSKIEPA